MTIFMDFLIRSISIKPGLIMSAQEEGMMNWIMRFISCMMIQNLLVIQPPRSGGSWLMIKRWV
ncbi:hypothetical protein OR16_40789 [Cupriavidus basilensis OR16]|uniref:Uncharacterized protein n=1 Tax=Cupriavidus basilensis OR16 TaxID=1127483 RepID=H1SI43_9BURK|nr:hypothetical protein OR16_40789 [Cupriavidus basilensis OR16]